MNSAFRLSVWMLCALLACAASARETVRLPATPALSPDGKTLAFEGRGRVWLVSSTGGASRPWTHHGVRDTQPHFSPDGKRIAFISERSGSRQVHVANVADGDLRQVTFHSEGCALQGWYPDGKSVLVSASRDHAWRHAERFFRVDVHNRTADELLFDTCGHDGRLSADGQKLLFAREGTAWWLKGYHGSAASQIWLYDIPTAKFTSLVTHEFGARSPLWQPDGKGFYYVGGQGGCFHLRHRDLAGNQDHAVSEPNGESVVCPCISADGSTIVFRRLFDLYCYRPAAGQPPRKLDIYCDAEVDFDPIVRRTLRSATEVAFSDDGLEMAFVSGGDVWVMDTELRRPRQVTHTPGDEYSPVFSPDGKTLLFVGDAGPGSEIWQATRGAPDKYWWENEQFKLQRLTSDGQAKARVQFSPTGEHVSFVRSRGDLCVMRPDGKEARCVQPSCTRPSYDWSPDGKWLVCAVHDNDFNRDIWILPIDGSRPPFNVSRHPDNEGHPRWSPDGKIIAFIGHRTGNDVGLHYVYLQKALEDADSHERSLTRALEKMRKTRNSSTGSSATSSNGKTSSTSRTTKKHVTTSAAKTNTPPKVVIDFEGLHDRIHRVGTINISENELAWSLDSKKLLFTANVGGDEGTYTVTFPDDLKPSRLTSRTGKNVRWLTREGRIGWLSDGVPGSLSSAGDAAVYGFSAPQEIDLFDRHEAVFDACWRTMRDRYYDEALGNCNWDKIRAKYGPLARTTTDVESLADVITMMLGELKGSHLGFTPLAERANGSSQAWKPVTGHLGARFDRAYRGAGWKIKDIIPDSPADKVKSRLRPGELILSVDGKKVDSGTELSSVLTAPPGEDFDLLVRDAQGKERHVLIRPISYESARTLLYDAWVRENQRRTTEASKGQLGYLHIQAMNMSSFYQFERDLFAVASGKAGLVIDVRDNRGGSITDHLLTALTQPVHAVAVARGGQPGYPQDRKVYATWNKPIVVLCNQNSFSNAESFTHAIKTLKRGPVIGVPTGGGVISTERIEIMETGRLGVPGRGWFLIATGEDMELNGAVPDYVVWPTPDDLCQGKDPQLAKGLEVLQREVEKWQQRPQPRLRKASQREGWPQQ